MALNKGDESLFRTDLASLLRERLSGELAKRRLAIGEGVKILYDVTATMQQGRLIPRLGFLDQDIVFFKKADVEKGFASLFHNTTDLNSMSIPHLIIETKYRGISSHGLIIYSSIANRIKGVFANAKYFLLVRFDNKTPDTILRHGGGFDRIIQLGTYSGNRAVPRYRPGALRKDLSRDRALRRRFDRVLAAIVEELAVERLIR